MTDARARANNIGLLRLILALLVLFSHSFPLSGSLDREPLYAATDGLLSFGFVAVDGFFLLSGFLILQSFLRTPSAAAFVAKRIRRLYPGYLVAWPISLLIGAIWSGHAADFLVELARQHDGLIQSALFLRGTEVGPPEAFPNNPFPIAMNGSTWTLQFELMCYAALLAAGSFGLLRRQRWIIGLAVVWYMIAFAEWFYDVGHADVHLARFLKFFTLGSCVATLWPSGPRVPWWGLVAALGALALSTMHPVANALVYPLALAVILFGVAFLRATPWAGWFHHVDLSYGVYIYAFPIQQIIISAIGPHQPLTVFYLALPPVLSLAALSWHFIEAPCLRVKDRSLEQLTAP